MMKDLDKGAEMLAVILVIIVLFFMGYHAKRLGLATEELAAEIELRNANNSIFIQEGMTNDKNEFAY